MSTLVNMSDFMRDLYPLPGERIKQWVVDRRRDHEWDKATCPHVQVAEHDDNTGTECRNVGSVPWIWLQHDCCYACNDLADQARGRADLQAWFAERKLRPPRETDESKLSDEIQPDVGLGEHPLMKWLDR